ncbi:tetraacyldisaccharide 4'-kinase [Orrella daihaiensis]|uniref:Tetraacyldisaccharide 4'-kinase n=1 Tax=Orrella daihaiensis TaxID=2782176 RepID=A0ABY4AG46_9BURK|nr:tetraacyldisaccharide 4'-kinase [Orrella daihaiensis]UOD49246.1 tetraacyldisaccharide 4'-kinase [Orrella daihaiensis]
MSLVANLQSWIRRQWQKRGLWAWLTIPIAILYGLISKHRRRINQSSPQKTYRAPVPVLVIGNIYTGGTGKTPIACELGRILQAQGWHPGLVSRGYGRTNDTTVATGQGDRLDWRDFGDEPALIAAKTGMPVSVHSKRELAVKALMSNFPQTDIIISDDGLQHYRLARDFEIIIQDERGVGNGILLPAGPLREPPARLDEVDLVLTRSARDLTGLGPCFDLQIESFWQPSTGVQLGCEAFAEFARTNPPVAALAGIGVPQRFFDSLAEIGLTVDHFFALGDHAQIDFDWLEGLAAATILMTEKDAVKLPHPLTDTRLWVAQTSVQWRADAQAVLINTLAAAGIQRSES